MPFDRCHHCSRLRCDQRGAACTTNNHGPCIRSHYDRCRDADTVHPSCVADTGDAELEMQRLELAQRLFRIDCPMRAVTELCTGTSVHLVAIDIANRGAINCKFEQRKRMKCAYDETDESGDVFGYSAVRQSYESALDSPLRREPASRAPSPSLHSTRRVQWSG